MSVIPTPCLAVPTIIVLLATAAIDYVRHRQPGETAALILSAFTVAGLPFALALLGAVA